MSFPKPGFSLQNEYKIGATEFKTGGKGRPWKDVADDQWNNWIWQQQNRVRTMDKLKVCIDVTPDEEQAFDKSSEIFNMAITPYYAALMDPAPITYPPAPRISTPGARALAELWTGLSGL